MSQSTTFTQSAVDYTDSLSLDPSSISTIPINSSEIPRDKLYHFGDLSKTSVHKNAVPITIPSVTYAIYVQRAITNMVMTLVFDWTMPFLHPFNFLIMVTVVPALVILLLVVEGALHLGFMLGLGTFIQNIGKKWGDGLSPVNWWDPRIFSDEVNEIVQNGIDALDQPVLPPIKEEELDDTITDLSFQTRRFNLDMAELLLFMSSIVYERDDELVRKAHKNILKISRSQSDAANEDYLSVYTDLTKSETRIHEQAEKWGLIFTSLSELNSLGGPFSGIFWSEEHNFIVVVFKGTTPTNFEDFMVDLMLQRVDARSFVFGEVHEGFFTSLFPASNFSSRGNNANPFNTIIKAIRAKAADIINLQMSRNKNKNATGTASVPINVWITGHSLGAALATLFYSRLLKSPKDLGPNCVLRDGYVFGTPSIGDQDFAAEFASYSNLPSDQQSTLWRIIDDTDIVSKCPLGLENPVVQPMVAKSNSFNYFHVGEEIRFFHNGSKPKSSYNLFASGKEPVIIGKVNTRFIKSGEDEIKSTIYDSDDNFLPFEHMEGSPLKTVERIIPTFFKNHFPARYFAAMQKARKYFNEE